MTDWLPAGRVGRAHGLDGSFHVTRPRAALLELGAAISVGGRETRITRLAGTAERPILRVDGVSTREQIEELRGADLTCPRSQAPALGEQEWWAEDLEGCEVFDGEARIGRVSRLMGLPSCEVLEVERDGAQELLVPMVRDAIRSVDVAARRIDVDLEFLGLSADPGDREG